MAFSLLTGLVADNTAPTRIPKPPRNRRASSDLPDPPFMGSTKPLFLADLPTGTAVLKILGLSSTDLAASPIQALNVPPYANWTDQGWNVRVHGNVYKEPDIPMAKVDDLAKGFLVDVDIAGLPASQQNQARNVTRSIFVVQEDNDQVVVDFVDNGASHNGGAINARGGAQSITLPFTFTTEGDFDSFVVLQNTTGASGGYMMPGHETDQIQLLDVRIKGAAQTGNATAWLVPPTGISVISDIDDILRMWT